MIRSRREFMAAGAAGGIGLLTFSVGGVERQLSAAQARKANLPYRTLTAAEVRLVDALGETLLPGSATAGMSHYIDQQLSGPQAASMLMIKYLGVSGSFTDFYRESLRAVASATRSQLGKPLNELAASQRHEWVAMMSAGRVSGWHGPPPGLVYFVLRSDAVDVVYGTQAGFESLAVPYMAHIPPPTRWGE
jgi:Gluconate 2-dehydrogenase subunit 3